MIIPGGVGVTISSQSGHRMKQLTPEEDEQLAITPAEDLLSLPILQPENIRDSLHAYQLAKRCICKMPGRASPCGGSFFSDKGKEMLYNQIM